MVKRRNWIRRLLIGLVVILLLGAASAGAVWWKFFTVGKQDIADDPATQFKYGSLGNELLTGIPYPIFMILPRVFPDLVAQYATEGYGPDKAAYGGYGAFGLAWEPGQRLPVGLSIKRLGYERVTLNCALCHTATYRLKDGDNPRFAVGGPGHAVNLQGLLRFLIAAANDRRFTAARLMPEIALQFPLDWLDWPIYSFILIPQTRLALQVAEHELGWTKTRPAWGPGRDDAFNLPKFILTQTPWDDSVGNTDFPAVWSLGNRDGGLLHVGGEAKTVYAVSASSAFGVGALPNDRFEARIKWLVEFLRTLAPPAFPGPVDRALTTRGGMLFADRCAACHAAGGARVGTAIRLEEIGTDPERALTWTQRDAERMNFVTAAAGVRDATLQGAQGYVARPLVGVWLLGPYLHNGSVPTLRDLLSPPAERPAVFYRGYDVLDLERIGFLSTGQAAERNGFRFDTRLKGNGNGGHAYGTDLGDDDRRALIEYLKTL